MAPDQAYASKATRNGIRVGELRDMAAFAQKLRVLALDGQKRFEGFQYDVEVRAPLQQQCRHTMPYYTTIYTCHWMASGKLTQQQRASLLD